MTSLLPVRGRSRIRQPAESDRPERVLAVVPVYGHKEMTWDLLADLRSEAHLVDVVVVDNRGDYTPLEAESVIRPKRNLGWAGGTNFGTRESRTERHTGFLWINNDTRLSTGHVAGLLASLRDTRAGLVGPFYDCHWRHQHLRGAPNVDDFRPRRRHFRAPFLDGTCMLVPAETIDALGLLDEDVFSPGGWGAEIDYSLRVRAAGRLVVVTELAYLHHEKAVTATEVFPGGMAGYAEVALPAAMEGLRRKWGDDWMSQAGLNPTTFQTSSLRRRNRV